MNASYSPREFSARNTSGRRLTHVFVFLSVLFGLVVTTSARAGDEIDIDRASWDSDRDRLTVRGDNAPDNATVTIRYGKKEDNGVEIGTTRADGSGDWEFRISSLNPVPCDVTAQTGGDDDDKEVRDAPSNCSNDGGGGGTPNQPPTADANGPYTGTTGVAVNFSSAGSNDSDGNIVSRAWDFGDGGTSSAANPSHSYAAAGSYNVTLTVTDNNDATGTDSTSATITDTDQPPVEIPDVSINSTSQNGTPGMPVPEQPLGGSNNYQIFAINDLGMHCGDLDTRVSSILPPFNVLHAQVIERGGDPNIMTPDDGVNVVYSASSNPNDPILSGINSAGSGPVLSSIVSNGSVYKTNFWDIARAAYDPFYPPGILPAFYPLGDNILDLGLPMPNVERLYLGDGMLTAEQQEMPGRSGPYTNNAPLTFNIFTVDQPFFLGFPFGYVSEGVDWYEAAGIPLTAFDDFGRENPWQLMRVQAKAGGQILASQDMVAPISGEANCGICHNAEGDGGNGAATVGLTNVALAMDDPQFDNGTGDPGVVPLEVSLEWAADLNLLRLHDQEHGTSLEDSKPVVCQTCHYTPALDLAQVGPKGPDDADANGRQQTNVKSMSNVMHSNHATVTDTDGNPLFPAMPPPVDDNGNLRNPIAAREVLEATCYQCHPGRRTDCLRGAMASGGMLCQDCHGDMAQVGDDFTRNVSPDNPGAFEFVGNFYTDPDQPRVPWANEPGCGSCHTGDAMDNMHGDPNTIGDPDDNIRLMQAYLTNDTKATPIVPDNRRFAENTVPATFDGTPNPGAGNPMLYRVSKGHEGVFCEACHGATHGIWPNGNPDANDNVAAMQLQGHTGTISECSSCHTGDLGANLDGPHGMHPIGNAGVKFAEGDHEELAKNNPDACRACHGQNGEGTVLSAMHTDRVLKCDNSTAFCPDGNSQLFPDDHQVGCTECHDNEL